MNKPTAIYPFAAVSGQADFKLALLLTAINPFIGGVLISGPRGCAKSTLSKGLAELLPAQQGQVHPFVTLPLGASEEMLIGTLDLQQVLNEQQVTFKPGLLSKAHGGVLYIDEINLLPDNLVDQLLDVAASGVNFIERDGISHQHAARFVLLGTMNPDEGELRPQLTDRFGLSVQLSNAFSVEERVEIVQLREQFDANPDAFRQHYQNRQNKLQQTIANARMQLAQVQSPTSVRRLIAERAQAAQVDGLRADIVWLQAARAHAALEGQTEVTEANVLAIEGFVLNHRRKQTEPPAPPKTQTPNPPPFKRPEDSKPRHQNGDWGAMTPDVQKTQSIEPVELPVMKFQHRSATAHSESHAGNRHKGSVRGFRQNKTAGQNINWFSTFAASAGQWPLTRLLCRPKREAQQTMHVILLDTSGSVLSNNSFGQAKGLVMQIAQQVYLKREQICLIGFGNESVQTLLPMRRAPKQIRAFLDDIKAAGGTPFLKGLSQVEQLQKQHLKKNAGIAFRTIVITDGRVKNLVSPHALSGEVIVVDIEQVPVKRGKARNIAQLLNAAYVVLPA